MKTKKLAALGLSAALTMSLASPAFASNTTKITGTYREVPIAVTVPTTGAATINPYGLPVKVQSNEDTPKTLATISGQKITTMPMAIYSKTEVGLLVSATVTGEVKGNLKLSSAAIPAGSTTNNALIYLETKTSALEETNLATVGQDGTVSPTAFGPFEGWKPASGSGASATPAGPDETVTDEITLWDATTYSDARNQILVGTTAKSKTGIGYLTAADEDNDNALVSGGAMWFRLAGDVVSAPKTPWTSKDGATVTVAFTFAPAESAGVPGKINPPASLSANTAATFTIVDVDANTPKMTFGSDATYAWTAEAAEGTTGNATFGNTDATNDTSATPSITFTAAGDYIVRLTVTENNVPYVAEPVTVTVS